MRAIAPAVVASLILLASQASAQIRLPGTGDIKLPSLSDILKGESPLTTTILNAGKCYGWPEMAGLQSSQWIDLTAQDRGEDGSWKLKPGYYRGTIQTFCGRGYTYGPTDGDGYVFAQYRGSKAEFLKSALRKYSMSSTVSQQDMQLLIWAVLARVKPQDMNGGAQRALVQLASDGDLKVLADGALDHFADRVSSQIFRTASTELRPILDFENKIRGKFREADAAYEDFERLAVLPTPRNFSTQVPTGTWNLHPSGYIFRLKPSGYSQSEFEVVVPRKHRMVRDDKKRVVSFEGDGFALALQYDAVDALIHPSDSKVKAWKVKGIRIQSGETVLERVVDDWVLQGAPQPRNRGTGNGDVLVRMIRPVLPRQDWGTWGSRYERARDTRDRILTYEEWYQREQRIARGEDPDGDVFDSGHIRDLIDSLFGGTDDRLEQIGETHGRLMEHLSHATGLLETLPDGTSVDPSGDVHLPGNAGGQTILGSSARR